MYQHTTGISVSNAWSGSSLHTYNFLYLQSLPTSNDAALIANQHTNTITHCISKYDAGLISQIHTDGPAREIWQAPSSHFPFYEINISNHTTLLIGTYRKP